MSNIALNPSGIDFIDYRDPIWGDSYNWSWNRPLGQVKYLVIHHSVTDHEATPDDIALLHKARGWGGIGYHFVITKDGTVYYVGDIGTARANVKDKNEQVIGICLVGDFTKHLPSDDQIISAHKLCQFFIENYPSLENVNGWDNLVGHKDLQATACPGSSWGAEAGGNMKWRIQTGTPYTPQEEEVDWKEKYATLKQNSKSWEETSEALTTFRQNLAQVLGVADDTNTIKAEVKDMVGVEDRNEDLKREINRMFAKIIKIVDVNGFQKAWTEASKEEREIVLDELDKVSDTTTSISKKLSDLTSENERLLEENKRLRKKEGRKLLAKISGLWQLLIEKLVPKGGES